MSGKMRIFSGADQRLISSSDLRPIVERIWEIYLFEAPTIPQQKNLRTTLVMNFACLTFSGYTAMIEAGMAKQEVIDSIYDLTWDITARSTRLANRISKLLIKDASRRMEYLVDLVMKLVFSPPAYQTQKGVVQGGFFMDVCSCPVAEYMISKDAAELCVQTWCGVDFGLVELIGGRLERSGTRAMGKEKCDFVFFES